MEVNYFLENSFDFEVHSKLLNHFEHVSPRKVLRTKSLFSVM